MAASNSEKALATPQLSCELCRDRKVKCDKLEPCTNCLNSGVTCVPVYRLRLPRGRHAHRPHRLSHSAVQSQTAVHATPTEESNAELNERIRRLESLVQSINSARASRVAPPPPVSTSMSDPKSPKRQDGPDDFWEDLVQEIGQLRDIVVLRPGDAEKEITQSHDPSYAVHDTYDGGIAALGLWGEDSPSGACRCSTGRVPLYQDKAAASQLCEIYLNQVDPIMKILHRPSLSLWLVSGQSYLHYPAQHVATSALAAAICYAAANSMTEDQSQNLFEMDKSSIVLDCREACEAALQKSGLLTTRDITVLQAFVLYLGARQTAERNRAVWTLVATAVRVARGLRLHLNIPIGTPTCKTFYDQQIQKRLWLFICVLDLQASLAQSSQPLIGVEEVSTALSLVKHLNDSDFEPETVIAAPDKEGLTDITFALVKFHLQVFGRQTREIGTSTSSGADLQSKYEITQQHAEHFEQQVLQLMHFCDPEVSPYAWFTWHSTQLFVAGARIALLRPLNQARTLGNEFQAPMEDSDVLVHTIRVLDKIKLMHTDSRAEGFRWMVTVQWHVLAVAIAECYVCKDESLVHQAWELVEFLYERYENLIRGRSGGQLQGPLGRLMRQTREKLQRQPYAERKVVVQSRDQSTVNLEFGELHPAGEINMSESRIHSTPNVQHQHQQQQSTNGAKSASLTTTILAENSDWDESWQLWEEFMCDVSFDELNSPNSIF